MAPETGAQRCYEAIEVDPSTNSQRLIGPRP